MWPTPRSSSRPWQPQQRVQLKNRDGKLMGPVEELEVLGEYAVSTFGAHWIRSSLPSTSGPSSRIRLFRRAPRRRPPGSFALTKLAPLSAPS